MIDEHQFVDNYCEKQGHQAEKIIGVCLFESCKHTQRLVCLDCLMEDHSDHVKNIVRLNEILKQDRQTWIQRQESLCELGNVIEQCKEETSKQQQKVFQTKLDQDFEELVQFFQGEMLQCKKSILSQFLEEHRISNEKKQKRLQQAKEILNLEVIYDDLCKFCFRESKQEDFVTALNSAFKLRSENLSKFNPKMDDIKEVNAETTPGVIEKTRSQLRTVLTILEDSYRSRPPLRFQHSALYSSEEWVTLLDQKADSQLITFLNKTGQGICYVERLPKKDFQFSLEVQEYLSEHLCLGVRKFSERDHPSYNKSPYFCLHCNTGDGLKQRFSQKRDLLIVQYKHQIRSLCLLNFQRQPVANPVVLQELEDHSFYLWTNNHEKPIQILFKDFKYF